MIVEHSSPFPRVSAPTHPRSASSPIHQLAARNRLLEGNFSPKRKNITAVTATTPSKVRFSDTPLLSLDSSPTSAGTKRRSFVYSTLHTHSTTLDNSNSLYSDQSDEEVASFLLGGKKRNRPLFSPPASAPSRHKKGILKQLHYPFDSRKPDFERLYPNGGQRYTFNWSDSLGVAGANYNIEKIKISDRSEGSNAAPSKSEPPNKSHLPTPADQKNNENNQKDNQDPFLSPSAVLQDPVDRLLAPLLVLKRSLEQPPTVDLPGCLPRPHSSYTRSVFSSLQFRAPVTLTDVQNAYLLLIRGIQHPQSTSLSGLKQYRDVFLRALERDLIHVNNFKPLERIGNRNTGAGENQGLNSLEMRQHQEEIRAATTSIKCLAAFTREARVRSIFKIESLERIFRYILNLTLHKTATFSIQRRLYPFVAWFVSVQQLPMSVVVRNIDHILTSILAIAPIPDKRYYNAGEFLLAVRNLLYRVPGEMLAPDRVDRWIGIVFLFLWNIKNGNWLNIRMRVTSVLGLTAKILYLDSSIEVDKVRNIRRKVSEGILTVLQSQGAGLESLMQQLKCHLEGPAQANSVYALQLMSLLPLLMGPSFQNQGTQVITEWLAKIGIGLRHEQEPIRVMAAACWAQLAYPFWGLRSPNKPIFDSKQRIELFFHFYFEKLGGKNGKRVVWEDTNQGSTGPLASVLGLHFGVLSRLNARLGMEKRMGNYDYLWKNWVIGHYVPVYLNSKPGMRGEGKLGFDAKKIAEVAILGLLQEPKHVDVGNSGTEDNPFNSLLVPTFFKMFTDQSVDETVDYLRRSSLNINRNLSWPKEWLRTRQDWIFEMMDILISRDLAEADRVFCAEVFGTFAKACWTKDEQSFSTKAWIWIQGQDETRLPALFDALHKYAPGVIHDNLTEVVKFFQHKDKDEIGTIGCFLTNCPNDARVEFTKNAMGTGTDYSRVLGVLNELWTPIFANPVSLSGDLVPGHIGSHFGAMWCAILQTLPPLEYSNAYNSLLQLLEDCHVSTRDELENLVPLLNTLFEKTLEDIDTTPIIPCFAEFKKFWNKSFDQLKYSEDVETIRVLSSIANLLKTVQMIDPEFANFVAGSQTQTQNLSEAHDNQILKSPNNPLDIPLTLTPTRHKRTRNGRQSNNRSSASLSQPESQPSMIPETLTKHEHDITRTEIISKLTETAPTNKRSRESFSQELSLNNQIHPSDAMNTQKRRRTKYVFMGVEIPRFDMSQVSSTKSRLKES